MFNKEFYPTPKWLIKKMLDSIDIKKVKYILEPSAGKGDIIDEIKEKYDNCYGYRYSKSDVDIDAIEVDDNLIHTKNMT